MNAMLNVCTEHTVWMQSIEYAYLSKTVHTVPVYNKFEKNMYVISDAVAAAIAIAVVVAGWLLARSTWITAFIELSKTSLCGYNFNQIPYVYVHIKYWQDFGHGFRFVIALCGVDSRACVLPRFPSLSLSLYLLPSVLVRSFLIFFVHDRLEYKMKSQRERTNRKKCVPLTYPVIRWWWCQISGNNCFEELLHIENEMKWKI